MPNSNSELAQALAPFEKELDKATEAIETALATLGPLPDLTTLTENDIVEEDSAQLSRIVYVSALLRIASAIRAQPRTLREELTQASLGMAYVKHIESANLKAMHFGRHQADSRLAIEVGELRAKLSSVAQYKAKYPTSDDPIDVVPDEKPKDT